MQYEVTDGVHAREKKGLKKKRSAYCKYACVLLFMNCVCENEQRHMQTHPVPTHFLCAVVYIKKQPRRRSKSRISRVDLHLTVSYSVSSSSPSRIPPCFPQTCSFAVIWRLAMGTPRVCFDHDFCSFSWVRSMEIWDRTRADGEGQLSARLDQ